MITPELARRLQEAGLVWRPAAGDRFAIPDRDLDDDVFVVSDMVVQVHELPAGRLLGFNGTTEWALDSVMEQDVLWLPREDQLRELLGPAFGGLTPAAGGFSVALSAPGEVPEHFEDSDAECAYALALLALLAKPATDADAATR